GENLAFLHLVAIIHVQLFHDAARLGLNLDLRDGLDLSGSHHALCQVSLFHLGQLRGVDLCSASGCDQCAGDDQDHNDRCYRAPDNDSFTPLLPAIAVAFHDRLLLDFKPENCHSIVVTGETSSKFPEKLRRDGACPVSPRKLDALKAPVNHLDRRGKKKKATSHVCN